MSSAEKVVVDPAVVIEEALVAAFGEQPRSALIPLSGGLSGAALFTFTVGAPGAERAFVVRRSVNEPQRVAQELRCLQLAAEIGVAPQVVHVDAARGVAVMEKIEGGMLGRAVRNLRDPGMVAELALLLRRLHDGPAFPPNPPITAMTDLLDGAMRGAFGAGLPASLLQPMKELGSALLPFSASAPCHYDLNPNNVLVTDAHVYLVDWELAGQGDPYLDLAQLGVFLYPHGPERDELHRAYLGREPTEAEAARMYLTRALALGYYACGFHHVMARMGMLDRRIEPADAPTLAEIHAEVGAARERVSPVRFSAALRREMEEMRASPRYSEAAAVVVADAP